MFVSCVVIALFFFIFSNSSFEFVYKAVDCSVHILFRMVCIYCAAIHMGGCFGFVPELFDGQNTMDVRHDVKVASYFFNFGFDIFS